MPLSQVGNVITLTNASTKAITSIADVQDSLGNSIGFRATCASHGYSNNNVVGITGTTDYNGPALISNATTNTFDVVYQADEDEPAFTSSQTGLVALGEPDPSGLSAMSGVTIYTFGKLQLVDLGSNELHVEGALMIDPRGYCVVGNVANRGIYVNNGGGLILGKPQSGAAAGGGEKRYVAPGVAFINTADIGASWWLPGTSDTGGDGCFCVDGADSYLRAWNATIVTGQFRQGAGGVTNGFGFTNGANIRLRNFHVNGRSPGLSGVHTANLNVKGLHMDGTSLLWYSEAAAVGPEGFSVSGANAGLAARDSATFSWVAPTIRARDCYADVPVYSDTSVTLDEEIIDCPVGANLVVRGSTTSGTDSHHRARVSFKRRAIFDVKDATGSPIEDAVAYVADYDNGQRKDLNGFDDTDDKTYTDTTDSSGRTGTLTITTAIVNVESTASTPAGASDPTAGTSNSGVYRVDFRGKYDTTLPAFDDAATQAAYDDTAKFDAVVARYGYRPTFFETTLIGDGATVVTASLIADPFVTLSEAAAAALTGIVIDDATETITIPENHTTTEIYDYIKWHEQQNPSALRANNGVSILTTADGVNHTCLYDVDLFGGDWEGTGVLDLGSKTLSTALGLYIGAFNDSTGNWVYVSAPNLLSNSRIRLYDNTNDEEITNEVLVASGLRYSVQYTGPRSITLRAAYVNGGTAMKFIEETGTLTSTGLVFSNTQVENTIFADCMTIAGLANYTEVTECAADGANIEVDVDDPDNRTTVQRIAAWFWGNQSTEQGIRDFSDLLAGTTDAFNFVFGGDLTVENMDTVNPLIVEGGIITREDGELWINTAGGFIVPKVDKVYGADVSGAVADIYDRTTLILQEVTT